MRSGPRARNLGDRGRDVPGSAGPHDLLISKYVAGREKDRDYLRAAVRHRLADRATLVEPGAYTDPRGAAGTHSRQIEADFAA